MNAELMQKQTAQCAEGKYHSFIMGQCWKCGKTMTAHKADLKLKSQKRALARYHRTKEASHAK